MLRITFSKLYFCTSYLFSVHSLPRLLLFFMDFPTRNNIVSIKEKYKLFLPNSIFRCFFFPFHFQFIFILTFSSVCHPHVPSPSSSDRCCCCIFLFFSLSLSLSYVNFLYNNKYCNWIFIRFLLLLGFFFSSLLVSHHFLRYRTHRYKLLTISKNEYVYFILVHHTLSIAAHHMDWISIPSTGENMIWRKKKQEWEKHIFYAWIKFFPFQISG